MTLFFTLYDCSSTSYLFPVSSFSVACGFASYFLYKDYFSGREMILMLCVTYVSSSINIVDTIFYVESIIS